MYIPYTVPVKGVVGVWVRGSGREAPTDSIPDRSASWFPTAVGDVRR
jgi:hypothetical protein